MKSSQPSSWNIGLGKPEEPPSPILNLTRYARSLAPTLTWPSDGPRDPDLPDEKLRPTATFDSVSSQTSTLIGVASEELSEAVEIKENRQINTPLDLEAKSDIGSIGSQDEKRMKRPIHALQLENLATVKSLNANGANSEAKDQSGMTPLLLAAYQGKVDIVKELLGQGADVRARDKCQRTALHLAILRSGHTGLVRLLLAYNTTAPIILDVNALDYDKKTPLHLCAERDMSEAAKMLLDCNACLEARDAAEMTPMYYAIKNRRYHVFKLLLERGADISWQWPIQQSSYEIRTMLEPLKRKDSMNDSPTKEAKRKGSWSMASMSRRRSSVKS